MQRANATIVRFAAWARTKAGHRFLNLLLAATIVRLLISPFFALFGDQDAYIYWGVLAHRDFFHIYSLGASTSDWHLAPEYPPLGMYIFGVAEGLYAGFAYLFGLPAASIAQPAPLLIAIMKLPALVADLGITALIYHLARQVLSEKWALVAAGAYAFAPVALLDGALWGQTDAVMMLPLLLALMYTLRREGIPAGLCFALAVLFKPQPLIFLPLGLVYLYRWAGLREAIQSLAMMIATGLVICLPYLLPPRLELLTLPSIVRSTINIWPAASPGAFNLWYLVGAQYRNYLDPYIGTLSLNAIGFMLFAPVMLLVLVGIWRSSSPARLFLGAGLIAFASFDLTTLQHERYLFPAAILLLFATVYEARNLLFFLLCSLTAFLNMAISIVQYDELHLRAGFVDTAQWTLAFQPQLWVWVVCIALTNMVLLLFIAAIYLRHGRAQSSQLVASPVGT